MALGVPRRSVDYEGLDRAGQEYAVKRLKGVFEFIRTGIPYLPKSAEDAGQPEISFAYYDCQEVKASMD